MKNKLLLFNISFFCKLIINVIIKTLEENYNYYSSICDYLF